jgi:hypothetical protein
MQKFLIFFIPSKMLLSAAKLTDFRWIGTFVYRDCKKNPKCNLLIAMNLKNRQSKIAFLINNKKK